jgi:beta-glucosidase
MEPTKKNSLVSKMTLKEKVTLLSGDGDWTTHGIPVVGIFPVEMHDGPLGLRKPLNPEEIGDNPSASSVPATCFPAPCLSACAWDPSLIEEMGKCMAWETIDQKTNIILAPGVNIKRNPLCGRNFEYLSEDPLLAGKLGASLIFGIQSEGIGVSLKHFACNNQETRRLTCSSEVDERALREIYLKPFEIAVKEAQPWTVMCSYNLINGVFSSNNKWLLVDVLKKEWNFQGCVISDWGAVNDPVEAHANGLDLEMPCHQNRKAILIRAVKENQLPVEVLDDEVTRLTDLAKRAFAISFQTDSYDYSVSRKICNKVIEQSAVLAKNENNILPLASYSDCCVIGAFAKCPRYQGAGSSHVHPRNLVSFLDATKNALGDSNFLPFAKGYPSQSFEDPVSLLDEAVALASQYKTVLLFLGLRDEDESEGFDRKHMNLPGDQLKLFDAIYAKNQNIIVVLSTGSALELPFADKAQAILIAYLTGEAGGESINKLLSGKINPSGRLAETWPLVYNDVPSASFFPGTNNLSLYKESIFVGYRYYLTARKSVLYPFGFGLSYTSHEYSNLKLSAGSLKEKKKIKVSFSLANTGKVDGKEVIEVYISENNPKTLKPLRELKFFTKIDTLAGKTKKVSFEIPYSSFAHYDVVSHSEKVEGGQYNIEIGRSCQDIVLSAPITIVSDFVPVDRREISPSYYALRETGSLGVSDQEFEALMGRKISLDAFSGLPYNFNTSLGAISNTFIGSRIKTAVLKSYFNPEYTQEGNDNNAEMVLESPLRFALMVGIKEKIIMALIDWLNKHRFRAIWKLMFWRRKC